MGWIQFIQIAKEAGCRGCRGSSFLNSRTFSVCQVWLLDGDFFIYSSLQEDRHRHRHNTDNGCWFDTTSKSLLPSLFFWISFFLVPVLKVLDSTCSNTALTWVKHPDSDVPDTGPGSEPDSETKPEPKPNLNRHFIEGFVKGLNEDVQICCCCCCYCYGCYERN